MRVLHVFKTYFPETQGGMEEVIRQICHATRAHQVESRILTLSDTVDPQQVQREEGLVIRCRRDLDLASCGFSAQAFGALREQLAWADVVHYHHPWPFADLLHLFGRVRKPALATYHADVVRQRRLMALYRPIMRRFYRRLDRLVTTSQAFADSSPVLPAYRDKLKVIPLGLDEAFYPSADPQLCESWRRELGEDFFFFVGVLRYYKGLDVLLQAAAADIPVVIAGSGRAEPDLKRTAERLGCRNVRFVGQISDADKAALIQLSRAVVLPSVLRAEAFGVTLLEGAMYGKPLISTELGTGTSYVNQHGETGLVVPAGDAAALRTAMTTLRGDDALSRRYGAAARARFERLFTADHMARDYAALYRDLAAG